jgi:hypothetical protein
MTVTADQIQVRAYDKFVVKWGNGVFRVSVNRYWRVIPIPYGKTADTVTPNDYFIQYPHVSDDDISDVPDTPSPETEEFVTTYVGEFSPNFTRVAFGVPYEVDRFDAPGDTLVNGQTNLDFNFYNIFIRVNGETAVPGAVSCTFNVSNIDGPHTEPCGCLNNNGVLACGDPQEPFQDPWPPFQFSLFTGFTSPIKNISDLRDMVKLQSDQSIPDPAVNLSVNKSTPIFGQPFIATSSLVNFRTTEPDAYFAWCVDGKTQQGYVAGGKKIEETVASDGTKSADASGCCNLATRTPPPGSDKNGDGIDDAWQAEYYYRLTGKKGPLLLPSYDDDKDGYTADRFLDLHGERIAVAPGSVSSNKVPFITGDGSFPALEEYIWGTDPLEYDTDQDGYPDEADITGVGQKQIEFTSSIQPGSFPEGQNQFGGDRFLLSLKATGRITKKRAITVEPKNATVDSDFDLQDVVRVVNTSRWFFARDASNITTTLSSTPVDPGLNDVVTVKAQTDVGDRGDYSLKYTWYLKRVVGNGNISASGKPDGSVIYRSGVNLDAIQFRFRDSDVCQECQVGDQLIVSVDVTDSVSGQSSTAENKITVGATNSLLVYQDCNHDGSDEEVGSIGYCFKSAQVSNKIPVRVSMNLADASSPNFFFEWYIDHVRQTANCLADGQQSTAPLVKCGLGTSQFVFTPQKVRTTHEIEVIVYKRDLNIPPGVYIPSPSAEVVHLQSKISVGNPSVTIVYEPQPTNGANGYVVGDTIIARAYVEFLDPQPTNQLPTGEKQLQYTWYDIAGNVIKTEKLNSLTLSEVALVPTVPGVATRTVKVISPDYHADTNASQLITVTSTATTYVSEPGFSPNIVTRFGAQLASLTRFIPAPVRVVVKVFLGLTLFAGIVVCFIVFGRRRA